jgi:TatD DNase family protein
MAMTGSLEEASKAIGRPHDPLIVWGVGCHPRRRPAQEGFTRDRFRELAELTPVVGEIGLDTRCRTPWDLQLRTFRAELEALADLPRIVSIHAFPEPRPVLDELRHRPVLTPVMHGWRGTAAETREAVAMGCYFTIHSQVARYSIFRSWVPPEHILLKTDHGYHDPPAGIPCRIEWVEHLVGQQYGLSPGEVRRLAWRNVGTIAREAGVLALLPERMTAIIAEVSASGSRPAPASTPGSPGRG